MVGRRLRRQRSVNRRIDRHVVYALLFMAWSWIIGFCGVLLWHALKHHADPVAADPLPAVAPVVSPLYQTKATTKELPKYSSPLIIFTCSRPKYLSETLDDILAYIPRSCTIGCPIIISQDGTNPETQQVTRTYQAKFQSIGVPLLHIQHKQELGKNGKVGDRYAALSQHYGWGLKKVFRGELDKTLPIPERIIILEEDIHVAPDFFSYMQATAPLLDHDATLFAVSAFNDNGRSSHVLDHNRLLRSDFFPGLGWMMTRTLWVQELESKWPQAYWDDWLRDPKQRNNRQVIRPEVSRTFHFGVKGGTSQDQFGKLMHDIELNTEPVRWEEKDLSYLEPKAYKAAYATLLSTCRVASTLDDALELVKNGHVRLEYANIKVFANLAQRLGIMKDEKAMVPRTAYYGVVEVRPHRTNILFLTPPISKLKEYLPGV